MQLYFYNGQPTNYEISRDGKLYNTKTNTWLKGQISKNGYRTYQITTPDGKKRLYAHRMVMETYEPIENMDQYEVNHIDCNKDNNNIENLEWVTSSENKKHAVEHGLYDSVFKKVYCFNKEKQLVAEYDSLTDAGKICGLGFSTLSTHCNQEVAHLCRDHYWRFSSDSNFVTANETPTNSKKRVGKFTLSGELIETYDSVADAARQNCIERPNISKCCNGYLRSYKGFCWKFV